MSQYKDFMELIEEEIPSASSLGLRLIPSRPIDRPSEYYQQSLDAFAEHPKNTKKEPTKQHALTAPL